ncbi:MAG: phosphate/phosphite/phosphonate ABC transporter substrate-binding protein [Rhodospirillaceae bacterium]|nr:phosphate/phosphite/phosphonate ABC transporter substrate-binding protein [Rhodospirillales bacterium]
MIKRMCRLLVLPLLLAGCGPEDGEVYAPRFVDAPPQATETLVFGVHPLHNPHRLFQVYQPLIEHINRGLTGVRLRLEASRNYGEFEKKLTGRAFHFALPNPYQTVISRQLGYGVFGKMADDDQFRGIIITRKDSTIQTPADLRGKAVSYPAPTALAATMLPQYFLQQSGVDVSHDLDNRYVGSQESSIMNTYLGDTAAAATWPTPWRAFVKERPEIAAQLEVKWQTEPLVNNSLIARNDMAPELVAKIGAIIFALDRSEEGRTILARMELSRFEAADDHAYDPVAEFLTRFERDVRPVKEAQP